MYRRTIELVFEALFKLSFRPQGGICFEHAQALGRRQRKQIPHRRSRLGMTSAEETRDKAGSSFVYGLRWTVEKCFRRDCGSGESAGQHSKSTFRGFSPGEREHSALAIRIECRALVSREQFVHSFVGPRPQIG